MLSSSSPQWFDLERRLTGLQEVPVVQQFVPMNFGPGLNESLLGPRQIAANAFDWIESEHGLGIHRMTRQPWAVGGPFAVSDA
jgi:hypothetical protein